MTSIPDWTTNVRRYLANPTLVITTALDQVAAYNQGTIDIATPGTPFMALMEASAVNASALLLEQEAYNRKQYPSLALTQEDIYLHMSDADYAGRFAQPARVNFSFYLSRDEIYQRAMPEGKNGVRKLTIPRHSEITVAGVKFTMQYPIDVRIMPHGGLSVTYDNSQLSPLQALTTNVVPTKLVLFEGVEYLRMELMLFQLAINSQQYTTNLSQLSNVDFAFTDQFHYARVYATTASGAWREIRTTHTDQVFDPTVPTAVLKVTDKILNVRIPQIYATTQMLTSELRVDIYTTMGPVELILSDYEPRQFTASWNDYDQVGSNPFVDALGKFNTYTLFSDDTVTGGRNAMTLAELRDRVITNSLGKVNVPITNVNLGSRLADLGYDMVLDVDNITNRQFLATRALPEPTDGSTISGAGCTMMTLIESMDKLAEQPTVRDNGERVTILPKTLYQNLNGVLSIVPTPVIDSLMAMPVDVRARRINEANYLFSPFHYVLDMGGSNFEHRPYYLDKPIIETKSFVAQNPTAVVSVSVKGYQINRVDNGYLITLVLQSGQTWKDLSDSQVFCQMAFTPYGESYRAYQNGTQVGITEKGERVFTFLIGTNYDVDPKHNLVVDTFQMFDDPVHTYGCPLFTEFDVFFAVNQLDIEGFETSQIDQDMGTNILPHDAKGITHERLSVRLGSSTEGLWSASRSVVSANDYMRHLSDVPLVYTATIYEKDPITGANAFNIVNGNVVFRVAHAKGDPVLNDLGEPVMQFYAGDVVLDDDGQPVVKSTRKMLRQIDLFLVDGVYWFATDVRTAAYMKELPSVVVGWLESDLSGVKDQLLEKTELFFYPKSTLGNTPVRVLEDKQVTINAAQSFSVTYYLTGSAYRDAALRTTLTQAAVEVIHQCLQDDVVTMSEIISALRAKVSGDAISVSINGLGGTTPYETITLIDQSARLSIRKKAVAKADGTIGVEDDVSVSFVSHTSL